MTDEPRRDQRFSRAFELLAKFTQEHEIIEKKEKGEEKDAKP